MTEPMKTTEQQTIPSRQVPEASKRELLIFLLIAFAVPYVMGIPMYACRLLGAPTDMFANAQMFYPAAGVMLAFLIVRRNDPMIPRRFYIMHLAATVLMIVLCFAQLAVPQVPLVTAASGLYVLLSILGWVLLLTDRKEKREAYGLRWHGRVGLAIGILVLFVVIKTASVMLGAAFSGELGMYLSYWATPWPWVLLLLTVVQFPLVFLPFFGEEYGWRYYFQPLLQKRFGLRGGVLLLGVLWGLWHLPLNLFYYSPDTSLQSIVAQLYTCVTLGVFFAFAYMKTNCIWLPVMLHYLNNNLVVVYTGSAQISNVVFSWKDVAVSGVILLALYMPFLASKVFVEKRKEKQE